MNVFSPIKTDAGSQANDTRRQMALYSIILSIAVFGVFLNATSGEFVFDDWLLIEKNERIHYLSDWKHLLTGYRPIRTFSLAVLYYFFGDNPVGYHVFNILVHTLTTVTVFSLVRLLAGSSKTGFISALVFAIHPIQTDSVAYISGLRDTLCGLFYVSSFYFFVKYRMENKKTALVTSITLNLMGVLTKETAATLVFMSYMYDFVRGLPAKGGGSFRNSIAIVFRHGWKVLVSYRGYYALTGSIFLWAVWYYVILRKSSALIGGSTVAWHGDSFLLNFLSIPKIILYYIKQLLFPVHLLMDYRHFAILAKSVYEPAAIIALLAVGAMVIAVFRIVFYQKLVAFGMFWFLISLSPGLNLLPHHEFMAEHYLYLPMVGFALLLGMGFNGWYQSVRGAVGRFIWVVAIGSLFGFYGVRTIVRNMDWQNDLILSASQLKMRPDSPRTLTELSYLYLKMNLLKSAQAAAEKALVLAPDYSGAMNNLGVIYGRLGRQDEAIEKYEAAAEADPRFRINVMANIGVSYMILGNEESGIRSFEKALRRNPRDRLSLIALTHVYTDRGDFKKAAEQIRLNLESRPDDIEAYYLLATIYEKVLKFGAAEKIYDIILELNPDELEAVQKKENIVEANRKLNNIRSRNESDDMSIADAIVKADLYMSVGESRQALALLREALQLQGQTLELLKKHSEISFEMGQYEESERATREAMEIADGDPDLYLLMAKLYALRLEFARAEEALGKARQLRPSDPRIGQIADSIRVNGDRYRRVRQLEDSGENPDERVYLLGKVYRSLGLGEEAEVQLSAVPESSEFALRAKHELAGLYLDRRGVRWRSKAINILEGIVEELPEDTVALNRLGFTYFSDIKDYERALDYFSESLSRDPNQEGAARLRRIAEGIQRFRHAVLVENEYMLPYMQELDHLDEGQGPPPQEES